MVGHSIAIVEGPFTQSIFDAHYPLDDCVRRGAEFLDGHDPGWADRVKSNDIDMRCDRMCILGQLYGEAFKAVFSLDKDWFWMLENGFIMHPDDFSIPRYAALGNHWGEAVKCRQLHQGA